MTNDVLLGRYPGLFAVDLLREVRCYGGWLALIDELCEALELHLLSTPETPKIKVVQIKEKFGELRFYIVGGDRHCQALIAKAQARSLITCEVCGVPGTLIGDRWVSVRCVDHLQWQTAEGD